MKGFRRPLDICFWIGAALASAGLLWAVWPEAGADRDYYPRFQSTYRRGPGVLFDEGHWNQATLQGSYHGFAQLLRRDGYRLFRNRQGFVTELLKDYEILVVANPRGFRDYLAGIAGWSGGSGKDEGDDAFDASEIAAVREWVRGGGALLLIADPGSFGRAAQAMAASFGVEMTNRAVGSISLKAGAGLVDHPITSQVTRVETLAGQSMKHGEWAQSFLVLPDGGGALGIAVEFERGRVVIIGDSAALTARVWRGDGVYHRFGINDRHASNQQLVLNIMHWLSRAL